MSQMQTLKYPDVNVFVDAGRSLADVWAQASSLRHFTHLPGMAQALGSTATACLALRRLNLHELAGRLENSTLSVSVLAAWLQHDGDLVGALQHDPTCDAGQVSWVRDSLWNSQDARMHDLVGAVEERELVTTTNQLRIAERKLYEAGLPTAAAALMETLTEQAEIIDLPCSLRQAVTSGLLTSMLERVQAGSPDHLADIDWDSPTWSPRDRGARDATSAWDRRMRPEKYGVDGEDLFQMLQVQVCEKSLGMDVEFITSDWHAAHAMAQTGVARSSLYMHGATESGAAGVRVLEKAGPVHEERAMSVPQRRASASHGRKI